MPIEGSIGMFYYFPKYTLLYIVLMYEIPHFILLPFNAVLEIL